MNTNKLYLATVFRLAAMVPLCLRLTSVVQFHAISNSYACQTISKFPSIKRSFFNAEVMFDVRTKIFLGTFF